MNEAFQRGRQRSRSLLRLAFRGILGGIVAVVLTGGALAIVAVATLTDDPPSNGGYMNPSAAVGEGIVAMIWAAAIAAVVFVIGAALAVFWGMRRDGRREDY